MTQEQRNAIAFLHSYAKDNQWEFIDDGRERNVCNTCGWDSKKDPSPYRYGGLSHRPDCELRAAIEIVDAMPEFQEESHD